ncbi:hypothetical protein ABTX81_33065 [Kitasatospora sp. NPDC097605]|uniref:hypothetical protein n=1 Tax=Kitasatospora sp. NPDC097605 TaxID=3157226 RepID=UPI00331C8A37
MDEDEEQAYDLGAGIVTGSPLADGLPELAAGERVATMDAAVEAGRTAAPGPAVQRPAL